MLIIFIIYICIWLVSVIIVFDLLVFARIIIYIIYIST
jgi:hypothetical protein